MGAYINSWKKSRRLHSMQIYGSTCILLFCWSCQQRFSPGSYNSYTPSAIEIFELKSKKLSGYNGGITLTLKEDSKFEYKTCSHLLKGEWSEVGDSLFLNVNESYKWLDSTQNIAIHLDSVPYYKNGISFEIRKNKLFNIRFNYATKLKRSG